ncbi:ABC transporter permease [Cytobacillus oceanisediminis]|uniref:ABC transporter permease n=1 Tax=Cytobacillus oceanisediminis TaxID=665099 RepID=UPI00203FE722|nr:ABC transporter permease [Cytobacillus oceanisediminis]MCM3244938.1 ABC transporter permease [Cytobacillus oceanisediminis]
MIFIWQILKEQLLNLNLIFRLGLYEEKSKYKMHYLGAVWQMLNPIIQITIYWFIFGLGIRGGSPVGETPFFLWLIVALIPWLFIAPTITQASNSIYSSINLVSKMKFPVSVLPSIKIVSNSLSFVFMLFVAMIILMLYGSFPGVYLLQLPYYIFALYFLLFGLTILLSTLSTIIRDIQSMVQSIMRIMLYMLPILWNVDTLPDVFINILKLNPFFYIIEGFRNSLLGEEWFFHDFQYTLYFWLVSILILFIGSTIHLKFRHKFVDYI